MRPHIFPQPLVCPWDFQPFDPPATSATPGDAPTHFQNNPHMFRSFNQNLPTAAVCQGNSYDA